MKKTVLFSLFFISVSFCLDSAASEGEPVSSCHAFLTDLRRRKWELEDRDDDKRYASLNRGRLRNLLLDRVVLGEIAPRKINFQNAFLRFEEVLASEDCSLERLNEWYTQAQGAATWLARREVFCPRDREDSIRYRDPNEESPSEVPFQDDLRYMQGEREMFRRHLARTRTVRLKETVRVRFFDEGVAADVFYEDEEQEALKEGTFARLRERPRQSLQGNMFYQPAEDNGRFEGPGDYAPLDDDPDPLAVEYVDFLDDDSDSSDEDVICVHRHFAPFNDGVSRSASYFDS